MSKTTPEGFTRTPETESDPEFLSTLEKGLRVLRSFNQDRPEMQLSEVAAVTNLNPAVARRCLKTLVKLGYVAQHGRRFLLRPEVLSFGSAYLASMNIEAVATSSLQRVRDETGDSSSLAVLSRADVLYLVHVPTNRHIRLSVTPGTKFPAHATSLGRVLLAFQTDVEINAWLDTADLVRYTERTITSKDELRRRIMQVREDGYASAQDELDYGIVSVAVPIFNEERRAIAAINCSTSTTRIAQDELVRTRVPLLQSTARELEAALRKWPVLLHSLRH